MKRKVYFIRVKNANDPAETSEKTKKLLLKSGYASIFSTKSYVGIKTHFGEKTARGAVKPSCIKTLVNTLKKTSGCKLGVFETTTLYTGNRSTAIDHLQNAKNHGFTFQSLGAPIIIADGMNGANFVEVEIKGRHFKSVKIAADFNHLDGLIVTSHITGHCQTGFAGSLKNIGMGCAAKTGKLEQHSNVHPQVVISKCIGCLKCINECPVKAIKIMEEKAQIIDEICIGCGECICACKYGAIKIFWDENTKEIQEKMVEYALGLCYMVKQKLICFNFITNITKECDCMAKNGDENVAEDIGITCSTDPVAVDKATCDLILERAKGDIFRKLHPEIDWRVQLEYADKIGLGHLEYELIDL